MRKLLMGLVAASLVVSVGGCIFLDAQFEVGVDGSTDATFEVGILKSVMEMGEGEDPTTGINEGLAEGKWEREEFDRDEWHVVVLKGHAGPGESLFTEEAEMQPEFASQTHLFSTIYEFALPLPEDAVGVEEQIEANAEAPPQGEQAEVQVEGLEGAEELAGDLTGMMMTGGERGLRFAVTLPGRVIATNGEITALNRAAWRTDLAGAGAPEEKALLARSRLVNWPSVGRMGAELSQMGRYDLVLVLVSAVQRGVVPDPQTDAPLEATLDAKLYAQILDIMVALDAAVGPELANSVMTGLKLNADEPDAATVERVLARVSAEDFGASVEKDITDRLLEQLGAP